eukprot:CAMPEP_0116074790 /NCGR_PEP_ID=MMETSP0322-20121206/16227_1 /TAXON_ID=163516 /ORGANISM="Leptocylindrus danicus var. apora, Strain B651" /LENGTH=360 /DNA_ID=CAMNT_0003564681 /DNA_START=47 /DNA_END=1129 /DNA_ORIENTATION=+
MAKNEALGGSILRFLSDKNDFGSIKDLRRAILDHFSRNGVDVNKHLGLLNIQNKYFHASVRLLSFDDDDDDDDDDGGGGGGGCNRSQDGWVEDGIVLAFQSYKKINCNSSSYSITAGFDNAIESFCAREGVGGYSGELLRLCIAIDCESRMGKDIDQNEYEKEYSRRVLWCLDHGFEYVDACDLSLEGVKSGHDEREKEGFARVIEAISSTLWSTARMHQRSVTRMTGTVATVQVDEVERRDGYSSKDIVDGESQERDTLKKTDIIEKQRAALPKFSHEETKTKPIKCAEDEEIAYDELEKLMGEAQIISKEAKSGNLSDESRRQRAEETAMRLMEILDSLDQGPENFEDDSDNDSGNDA